ncbi:hypothetical protein CgunFtcFv8_008288 [Champsocephalus gunnari]|uniref:Uncharacterized protein n=1 Tax=Champsocephalus gunnari TaxID=52237 RepID=A0AAN8HIR5_CHAGU|nr:hypothetical protein CgunFtcFv8_008288 [Champsocephalus gunnari]
MYRCLRVSQRQNTGTVERGPLLRMLPTPMHVAHQLMKSTACIFSWSALQGGEDEDICGAPDSNSCTEHPRTSPSASPEHTANDRGKGGTAGGIYPAATTSICAGPQALKSTCNRCRYIHTLSVYLVSCSQQVIGHLVQVGGFACVDEAHHLFEDIWLHVI